MKITFVSDSLSAAARCVHVVTTCVELALSNWYSPVPFEAYAASRVGIMHPVRRLVGNFLRTGDATTLQELAPDLTLLHAKRVEWNQLQKVLYFLLFFVLCFSSLDVSRFEILGKDLSELLNCTLWTEPRMLL